MFKLFSVYCLTVCQPVDTLQYIFSSISCPIKFETSNILANSLMVADFVSYTLFRNVLVLILSPYPCIIRIVILFVLAKCIFSNNRKCNGAIVEKLKILCRKNDKEQQIFQIFF